MQLLELSNKKPSLPKDIVHEATICRKFLENKVNQLQGAPHSSKDLACYCAIASWFLKIRIKKLGYNDVHFILGVYRGAMDHCWVTVGNQIIDITATQFGVPDAVYIPTDEMDIQHFFPKYEDKNAIRQLQKWPKEQAIFLRRHNSKYHSYIMKAFEKFLNEILAT